MKIKEAWTIVWEHDGHPVPPLDDSCSDENGLLVYLSQETAEIAAEHQTDMYGNGKKAVAERLEVGP